MKGISWLWLHPWLYPGHKLHGMLNLGHLCSKIAPGGGGCLEAIAAWTSRLHVSHSANTSPYRVMVENGAGLTQTRPR